MAAHPADRLRELLEGVEIAEHYVLHYSNVDGLENLSYHPLGGYEKLVAKHIDGRVLVKDSDGSTPK